VDKGPVGDLEISRRPGGLPRGSAGQPAPPNVFSWLHPRTHTRRSVGRGACDTVSFSVTQMPFIIVCVVEVAHAQREQPARSAIFVQQADAGSIVIRADGATHRPPRAREVARPTSAELKNDQLQHLTNLRNSLIGVQQNLVTCPSSLRARVLSSCALYRAQSECSPPCFCPVSSTNLLRMRQSTSFLRRLQRAAPGIFPH